MLRNPAEEAFEAIATSLMSAPGVTAGTMFGARALKVRERVFAMMVKGDLVVKLPSERVEDLVSSGSGRLFDPGHGRLMKEWVAIPLGLRTGWSRLVGEAKDFVSHGEKRGRPGVGAARRAVPAKKADGTFAAAVSAQAITHGQDEKGIQMSHPNEDLIRRLYKAFASQDMPTIDQLLADDITWHAPGRARNAGTRRGKAALFAVMGELAQLTDGTMSSDVHDVLANDFRAVVLQTTKASREGRPALEDREVIVFELRKGKVTEVWEHPGDLYAMEAFFE